MSYFVAVVKSRATGFVIKFITRILLIISSADTKDETFTFLMDNLKALSENFGSGFLEDFIPLLRYCPTPKFRRQVKYIAAMTEHIKKEMEEHKETFVYGMIILCINYTLK